MVGTDQARVDRELAAGALACPGCGADLRPWGHARQRVLRAKGAAECLRLRPRRSRCAGCGATHVLLPTATLARRADLVVVIGAALVAKAAGDGHRRIAARLGRPATTVRDWLRRFAAHAKPIRAAFSSLALALDSEADPPGPTGTALADAVEAIGWAAAATVRRLGVLSPWRLAAAVTGGWLLAPRFPGLVANTSSPFAAVG
jgi:hypothetical protein